MIPINRLSRYFVSIPFIILSLISCTPFIDQSQDDLSAQVDAWIAANEYGKAIEAIHYVQPEYPQYLELKNRQESVLELAHTYEKKTSEDVEKMISENKWENALDLVEQARRNYPQGLLIYEINEKLHKKQTQQIKKMERRILIERAKWMQEVLPLYRILQNTDPKNRTLKTYVDQLEYEAELLAEQLTWLAEEAIEKKHYKTARLRLTMANNISPEPQRTELLNQVKRINKQNSKNVQKQQIAREKKDQEKQASQYQQALFNNIKRSYSRGWLAISKSLISQLDEKERQTPEIIQLQHDIDVAIEHQIKLLFAQADKLYEDGQFELAIEKWEDILLYEPENELAQEHIQRAEKVIEKITRLREKQQP